MTDPGKAEPTPTPRPQRFRLNIASLITIVLMLGLWLGWFARTARIQREAVAAITKARGQVLYDWQWRNGRPVPRGKKPWAPQWLVNAFGIDCFGNVVSVLIPHPSESDLSHIGNLDQLRALVITEKLELTDTGLTHLKRLKNLRFLDLRGATSSGHSVRKLEPALPYLVINSGY